MLFFFFNITINMNTLLVSPSHFFITSMLYRLCKAAVCSLIKTTDRIQQQQQQKKTTFSPGIITRLFIIKAQPFIIPTKPENELLTWPLNLAVHMRT